MSGDTADMDWIQTRFDTSLARSVKRAAASSGVSVGHLHARTSQNPELDYQGPRKPLALRAYLAHDFAYARHWDDLQDCLRAKGYSLAEHDGGLILQTVDGQRLCKAADIGQPYGVLMQRFGAPFSNRWHIHLEARHLGQKTLSF